MAINRNPHETDWADMVPGQTGWNVSPQGNGWLVTRVFEPDGDRPWRAVGLSGIQELPEQPPTAKWPI